MSNNLPGTPLPEVLSGVIVERLVRVDKSLLPYITGALEFMTDIEPYEPTGTLTVEAARIAFAEMLWIYLTEEAIGVMVGQIGYFAFEPPPEKWLPCDGRSLLRSEYVDLFDAIGITFGFADGTHFNIPDMRRKFPFGSWPTFVDLGDTGGELDHTLTIDELPAHAHTARRNTSTDTTPRFSIIGAAGTTGGFASTDQAGGGQPHNNVPPFVALTCAIYAGI